jgi:SagB-type dehydrogenase family enzyme
VIAVEYHTRTKHHFNRFARSLGYLDWANLPDPFRRYSGAPLVELPRRAQAADVPYDALFAGGPPPAPIDLDTIGEFLRCSMGLSAWKQFGASRWALRVNPSSGNLHPTETYVVHNGRVWHYAVREHAVEQRCAFPSAQASGAGDAFLVGLSSIIWREAWKYGERAFRYCQHDVGHAIAALRFAAALLGWRLMLLPHWSDTDTGALLGLDRGQDYGEAEREEPECVALVTASRAEREAVDPQALLAAVRCGTWQGRANRLSAERVEWPLIDEVVAATRSRTEPHPRTTAPLPPGLHRRTVAGSHPETARSVLLQRRSALAFDRESGLRRDALFAMLRRLRPPGVPWDAIDWPPHVHLVLFIHRVQDMVPGIYAYLRDTSAEAEWRTAMRPEFLWERVNDSSDPNDPNDPNDSNDSNALFLLVPLDCRRIANRLSCDQDIAEDGFFSLAMIARFEGALRELGEPFYRRLFWETGLIGQVLYLEAEAVGARSTGIGCFYDDPVHELLGLSGHAWQSLYHFSMGMPVEDRRLTSEPGYPWEAA